LFAVAEAGRSSGSNISKATGDISSGDIGDVVGKAKEAAPSDGDFKSAGNADIPEPAPLLGETLAAAKDVASGGGGLKGKRLVHWTAIRENNFHEKDREYICFAQLSWQIWNYMIKHEFCAAAALSGGANISRTGDALHDGLKGERDALLNVSCGVTGLWH